MDNSRDVSAGRDWDPGDLTGLDVSAVALNRTVDVLDADAVSALDDEGQRLVFRVVQECLANVVAHARASVVSVTAEQPDEGGVVVTVADDGAGFDPELLTRPEPDHFGLRVLADVASAGGAGLDLQTAPGRGTRWRLSLQASAVAGPPAAGGPGSRP